MKLTLLLADWAEVLNGKLYVMGGGWTETGPTPTPSALAALVEVDWDETNREHTARFTLVDGDNQAVTVPTPTGHEPLFVETKFNVGRPPHVKPGTSFNVPIAINVGPIPLPPGKVYVWRCHLNGEVHGTATFATRTSPPKPR
jgi:hypothetical protein